MLNDFHIQKAKYEAENGFKIEPNLTKALLTQIEILEMELEKKRIEIKMLKNEAASKVFMCN